MDKDPTSNDFIPDPSAVSIEQLTQVTNPEISDLASALVESLTTTSEDAKAHLPELWDEYATKVEAFNDSIERPSARAKAQVAAMIHKASIFQLAGNMPRYLEELDDAEVYAGNKGMSQVAASLDSEIKNSVESLDLSPEKVVLLLRGIIDEDNRYYLKDLIRDGDDLEDIMGHVYGMILEVGEDPDEVLAELGITA